MYYSYVVRSSINFIIVVIFFSFLYSVLLFRIKPRIIRTGKGAGIAMKVSKFNDRLRYALAYAGLTQTELSKKTDIGRPSISAYLKGEYVPNQNRIKLIADTLQVDPGWLMGYDVPMKEVITLADGSAIRGASLKERDIWRIISTGAFDYNGKSYVLDRLQQAGLQQVITEALAGIKPNK